MADCSELSQTIHDIVMNIASREGVDNFSDAVAVFQSKYPDIRREHIVEAIIEATTRKSRETDALAKKLNFIKGEVKIEKRIRDKISELENYLETGKLPEIAGREKVEHNDIINELQDIVKDLKSQIKNSEPALAEKLNKQIVDIEQKLASGDIQPKPRNMPNYDTPELLHKEYKLSVLKGELRDRLRDLKPKTKWDRVDAIIDLPRTFILTGEFSPIMMQGGFAFYSHPKMHSEASIKFFKGLVSAENAFRIEKEILTSKNAPLAHKAKLALLHERIAIGKTEEAIMTSYMDKIPVVKDIARATRVFFNAIRMSLFDYGVKYIGQDGKMPIGDAKYLANFINVSTGRGNMGSFEPAVLAMNRWLLATRWVTSRFQILLGQPIWHTPKGEAVSWKARKFVIKEYARVGLGLTTLYLIASSLGLQTESEETSTDFGQLKAGVRRIDPTFGLRTPIVFMSRVIEGQYKTQKGEMKALRGKERAFGGMGIGDVIANFERSKLSPVPSTLLSLAFGKTPAGKEPTAWNLISPMSHPITWGDIYDVMQEDGIPTDMAFSALAMLGWNLNVYRPFDNLSNSVLETKIKSLYNQNGEPKKDKADDIKAMKDELQRRQQKGINK